MFYEEKLIDGRLYCRGTPDGEWRLVTIDALTRRVLAAEADLERAMENHAADLSAAPEEGRSESYRNALSHAAYALFQIKRMADVPQAVIDFVRTEHAKACAVLDGDVDESIPMNNGGAPQDSEMPTSGLKGKQGADPADASPPPQLPPSKGCSGMAATW